MDFGGTPFLKQSSTTFQIKTATSLVSLETPSQKRLRLSIKIAPTSQYKVMLQVWVLNLRIHLSLVRDPVCCNFTSKYENKSPPSKIFSRIKARRAQLNPNLEDSSLQVEDHHFQHQAKTQLKMNWISTIFWTRSILQWFQGEI